MAEKNNQNNKQIEEKGFEEAMAELKSIVEALENQDIPLEKAVSMFEQGIRLSKYCEQLLKQAEKKVKLLTRDKETGEIVERDFNELAP